MTSFANIQLHEIKHDCRFYNGYKPCNKFDGCPDCPHYQPRGEQILVIKLGAMGDVLRCKSILPALKREHPQSWIVWITNPGSEAIARDPLVDEILTLSQEGLLALEGRHFSRLICLDKDKHAVALAERIDADRRQGFAPTPYNSITVWNEAAMYALRLGLSDDLKFRHNRKSMPEIVAEACELPTNPEPYALTIPADADARAAVRWAQIFGGEPPAGRPVLGLNTGCGPVFATKGWPRENMAEFIRLAGERQDVTIVLFGGPREKELHRYLMESAGDLAGRAVFDAGIDNSLEVFFGLVDRCDLLLSSDSLAMHIGIALRKPVIVWLGSTCEQEIDLYGRGEKLVTDFPCSPCYLKACPQPVFCMSALSAATVLAAVDRSLAARNP